MRIAIGGAGAIGASIAYHLTLLEEVEVVLVDPAGVAAGASGKAMGGVRQQFSTAEEVRLAKESIRFFAELGPPFFHQVGYLFVATTEDGLAQLDERRRLQAALGVPVEAVGPDEIAALAPGTRVDDVVGGSFCAEDGVGDPGEVTRELVRRAVDQGAELRDGARLEDVDADVRVVACGPWSGEVARALGAELPIRPLCRQLLQTAPVDDLPERLPMVIEAATGFHFRRRDGRLVLAMTDPRPRWGFEEVVEESLVPDRLARLAHRYPPAAGTRIERAWAGLYDMTPDAHPVIGPVGDGLYAACGFSGHGFMQSPAVGRAVADELGGREPAIDLSPYRLERFSGAEVFAEELVL